eukprot:GHRQ01004518.1.p1 GENE.GHRQ01004518.1~~GHRQ01004518.1.p1  ORF type:complete len:264 (+),score=100.44 GHRQ01004518.1:267-1058(+)
MLAQRLPTSCRSSTLWPRQQLLHLRSGGTARIVCGASSSKQPKPGSDRVSSASESEPAYAYSDPVNQFLGQFLPSNRAAKDELAGVDFDQPKLSGRSIQEMADLVEAGLSKSQWFVTGQVDPRLFSDSFAFKDESVATTGIRAYATGVRKLFDQATSKVELISVEAQPDAQAVVVTWRLEGRVNLPLKPKIKPYVVTTTLGVDPATGLINSQVDEFSVPGWDLLLSILLGEGFGAKPAPPAEELRAAAAAGGGKAAAAKGSRR